MGTRKSRNNTIVINNKIHLNIQSHFCWLCKYKARRFISNRVSLIKIIAYFMALIYFLL